MSLPEQYSELLGAVKARIRVAQLVALRAVNRELIGLYWDIGRMIVERQQAEGWGKAVVERLAADLKAEFPRLGGFSARNLWYMRNFCLAYEGREKLQPLVAEIGWSQNLIILERCKDDLEREFYLRMVRKYGWTKAVLTHQIDNRSYEKTLLGQTNFDRAVPEPLRGQAKLAVKDEYTFDFLELAEEHAERELERALLGRVDRFLREMGGLFALVGSQYRLEVGGQEYFIDLLLYHRRLKALVALELKVGEFKPEHVGKMQFYLTALDRQVRLPDESPSIGIVLCREKNRVIVEYALHDATKPIGVATYRITPMLPDELRQHLPSPEQIAAVLDSLDED